jgi:hypothetical protein
MSVEDAKYYISETKQFVSYEEFIEIKETWWEIKSSMVEEGE